MLSAIDLDDEAAVEAHEVDDVGAQRVLPPKPAPRDLTLAQLGPQQTLAVGHLSAKISSALVGHALKLAERAWQVTPTWERHRA